jgi:hypothetical protein
MRREWKLARTSANSRCARPSYFNSVAHNTPGSSANATYLLHPNGGGICVLYYRGNVTTPTHCTNGIAIGSLANPADPQSVCGVTTAAFAPPAPGFPTQCREPSAERHVSSEGDLH